MQFIFAISGFINFIVAIFFGVFVLIRKRTLPFVIFALLNLSTALWSFGYWRWLLEYNDPDIAIFWLKILTVGSIWIPILFVQWISVVYKNYLVKKFNKFIIGFSYMLGIFFTIANFSNLLIGGVSGKLYFIFWPNAGSFYILYIILSYLTITIYTTILLVKLYRKTTGYLKNQIKYLALGSVIALVGGFFNFFLWYDIMIPPYGNFIVPIYMILWGYSMIKYRLMNIRLVIARSILYTLLVGGVASFFALSVFLAGTYLGANTWSSKIITYLVSSSIIVIFLDPVKRVWAKITDAIFYKDKVDYQKLLRDASSIISREIDLQSLLQKINQLLTEQLKIQNSAIALVKNNQLNILAQITKKKIDLDITPNTLEYFKKQPELLITEELIKKESESDQDQQGQNKDIINNLEENNIEMVVPIVDKDNLNALFFFGNKLSGDVYSNEDINFFTVLAPQVATAIEKSKLYEEVQELNKELQAKVDERTKSLQQANLDLEDRNKFLTTMQAIINMISRTFDLNKVNQLIADAIASQLGYIGGILSFVDEEYNVLRVGALTRNEFTEPAIAMLSQDVHNYESQLKENFNLGSKTVLTARIHFASDMKEFFSPPVDGLLIDKVQAYLKVKTVVSVPIFSEDKVIGLIHYFMSMEREEISPLDIEMMTALSSQVGIVSRNLKLYGNLQKVNKELHEANLHLKALDKAKSEFLSIASHQLRTPISAVKGYLSMVLEGDFGPVADPIKKVVKDVYESAARLARVINVFLNVSRIEAGRLKIEKQPMQIVDMIDSVIKELINSAKQKNLSLTFNKPAEEVPLIYADSDKLREVVLNLIDNAIKYTPEGSIKIFLEHDDQRLTFISKDTGIGIHPNEAKNLFRKFVRGDGVAQIHTGGSGLGLFIAQKIIKEHGGEIWVESEGKGKGSVFQFTVPLATTEEIREFNKKNKGK